MDIEQLQNDWFSHEEGRIRENKKHKNRKKKGQYLHFDKRIPSLSKDGVKSVWNPNVVARHSFFPFIRFVKEIKHYQKVSGTKKKTLIPKKRPIDYAAHYDAAIYSWYSYILLSLYEKELDRRAISEVPIAYRSLEGKSNIEFAGDIIAFIKAHPDFEVLTFDVEKFFETLDHLKIKEQWAKLLGVARLPDDHYHVFRSLTEYHYVDIEKLQKIFGFSHKDHSRRQQVCSSDEFRLKVRDAGLIVKNVRYRKENDERYPVGIPQGTSLSCVLANLYMIDFDEAVSLFITSIGGLYRRYSDDVIVVVPKSYAPAVESHIEEEAKDIDLTLNKNKTERHHFVDKDGVLVCFDSAKNKVAPLQYLGIQFDGEEGFLRHAGIAKFQRRRNRAVRGTINRLQKGRHIPKKMYLNKFTYEGKENYLDYASRAQKGLKSKKIKRQVPRTRISKQLREQIRKNLKNKSVSP
jgi:hypothetical protein